MEENSPVRAVVRISGDIAGVPVVQRLTLYRGLKKIDLENTVDWKPGRFIQIEQMFPLERCLDEYTTLDSRGLSNEWGRHVPAAGAYMLAGI